MITYARAIHIYQNPYNLTETKCDVLISDGVIEHYDFNNHKEYILWNTCYSVDIFLYKNCPFKLVQDRLIEQYGDTSELDKESIDLHEVGNHFTINGQLIIPDTYYIVEVILLNNKGSFIKWTFLSIFLETHQNTVILRDLDQGIYPYYLSLF